MATQTTDYSRLDTLSRPKRLPAEYRDDRRSVYWVEKEPTRGDPMTTSIASARVSQLSQHKNCVGSWTPHRPSPIWAVSRTAMSAEPSTRLVALSEHRKPMPTYSFDRDPAWDVNTSSASASQRIESLSQPKRREEKHSNFDPYWGFNIGVSDNAMRAKITERLDYLAAHKDYHKQFKDERPIQSQVTSDAMEAIASLRLQQLARPRSRTLIKDDYDPYKVSAQAKKSRATPRLEELCAPIPRKCRTKIVSTKQ